MRLYITGGGFMRMPYVVLHENAMQPVIALPPPMWPDYSPRSVGDDFSDANAFVLKCPRKPVLLSIRGRDFNEHDKPSQPGYRTGSGSGFVIGGAGLGTFSGGGATLGS